ncbi:hypothetical protein Tco_0793999 [Tanacetum coccineum]
MTTPITTSTTDSPYIPSTVIIQVVPAIENSLAVPEHTTVETILNVSPVNKAYFESEKKAIHMILTGIGDEIYSTVNACNTAHEMWEAIERLQQSESLNIQDLMNEMIRNNLTVDKMQVSVQFLQQLQPKWSRFVTIVKQQLKLDEVSYHKFFDILKQYQKEVNELRAERIAKNANPLALVATAQPHQDPYYQTSKSHKSYAPNNQVLTSTPKKDQMQLQGNKAQKDKEMQKNLALIAKYFKKLYKHTNNNLRTSSNTRNKNVDTTPRYKNDNQSRQFGNQGTMTVVGARKTECKKPKRVKDSTYHKEKMLLCKQAKKAHYSYMAKIQEVPNTDSGTDSEPLEQVQYDNSYNVFANEIQHSKQSESISNTCVAETVDSNVILDSPDMCDNDIQNDQNAIECDDERVSLANLTANLKLDVDENKKIQKQLKKANASLTQELKECKSTLAKTSRTLGESNSIRDSCLVAL